MNNLIELLDDMRILKWAVIKAANEGLSKAEAKDVLIACKGRGQPANGISNFVRFSDITESRLDHLNRC